MQELFPLFSANRERGLAMEPWQLGVAISPMGITLILWPMAMPVRRSCASQTPGAPPSALSSRREGAHRAAC